MSTLQIGLYLSYVGNILLGGIVLLYVYPQIKQYIKNKKKRREKQANLERARFVKDVRDEVRRYLQELQK